MNYNATEQYLAATSITAGPSLVIESDGDVSFGAGKTITLSPGFHAKAGSNFRAYIDPGLIPPPPTAPTNLIILDEGFPGPWPFLDWDAVSNATSYRVYRRYGAGSWAHIATTSDSWYLDNGATLDPSSSYLLQYYVIAVNSWGESGPSNTASALGYLLKEKPGIPTVYALRHAYPNPFNPTTTIRFELPEPAEVRLVVYNLLGREVVWLVNERMEPGYHTAIWHGRDATGRPVPSGLYIARLVTPAFTKSIKMILLK